MKANELMIGDWVMYNGNIFIDDEYEPSVPIEPIQIASGEDIDLAIEGCYTPIPLTAEILEKNGWDKSSDGGWHTLTTKDNIYLEYHWGTSRIAIREVLGVTEMVFLKGKRFVHELQHALRLCGLTELADNFKV